MEALPRSGNGNHPRHGASGAAAQLIALLEQDATHALTISELLERGITTPGQALYELELVGYPLERVRRRGPGGHTTVAYRLNGDGTPPTATM